MTAHNFALAYGGLRGVRDLGAIELAVARPYCGYYGSIAKKAAVVQSLAANHGLIDGNKRTALLMMNLLLLQSGYQFHGASEQQVNADVEDMILALVEHRMSFDEAVVWLKHRIVPAA